MIEIPLLVDELNLEEINAFYIRRAVALFHARREEGCDVSNASAQACAYLRRKTGWAAPVALGALDEGIRDDMWVPK